MPQAKPLEILVYGSGSIGSIFGFRAQGVRARVTAVCRSNYGVAKDKGIEIRSKLWGNHLYRPDRVVQSTTEVSQVSYDYVVLATKSIGRCTESLKRSLTPVIGNNTTLVSAQNGVTSELMLRRCGFDNPILSTTSYISCWRPSPGIVEQVSLVKPHAFYIGRHSNGIGTIKGDHELDALVSLDQSFAKAEDAQKQRWEKMVFNAAWSPASALFEKDTHVLLQDPANMRTVRALASEAVAVGRASGVDLPDELVDTTISGPARVPTIVPSMLQDLRRKRPLEVEALCGGIIRFGHQYGVPTPIMETTYKLLGGESALV